MKLLIHNCERGDYSQNGFSAKIDKRLLFHQNGKKLEVEYSTLPEIAGHSDGRFNVMFTDKDYRIKDKNDDKRKYFAYANWIQRQELNFMFGKMWVQKTENILKILIPFITFLLGLIIRDLLVTDKNADKKQEIKKSDYQENVSESPDTIIAQ